MHVLKIYFFLSHACELCNERDHFSTQCKLFHAQIMSKSCDELISLVHHNELSLLLGYEELKRIIKDIPKFALDKVLHFNLEEIYMYCAVNCIENPYIANYIKKRKQIVDEENTNEREEASQYPPIISYDESGNEEEPSIQPISLIRSSKKRIEPTNDVKKKKRKRKRGKKISLPNNDAPITIVPHENIIVEDNDTSYDLENLFGTCLEEYNN